MSYFNCPRCALSIRVRADYLSMTNCPRCLGRARMPVAMYETPEPAHVALFRRPPVQVTEPPPD
jgi:hypothetical protein